MKKYHVILTDDERTELTHLIQKERVAARKRTHAHILLKADETNNGWTDKAISNAYEVSLRTIERVRERFVEDGLTVALNRRLPEITKEKKIDGDVEAHLTKIACSDAPRGSARWTLRLLADEMVRLNYIDSISHEGVRKVLKKTNLSLG